jgi:hypothetical protein
MTATIRVPVSVDVDMDDDDRGFVLVKAPDDTVTVGDIYPLSRHRDRFVWVLEQMIGHPGIGISLDTGFVGISMSQGSGKAHLDVYPDSFSDPVRVRLESEDLRGLLEAVRRCWFPAQEGSE